MSAQLIPFQAFRIDSLSDIESIPGGVKAGRIYFFMGTPKAIYACFDGATLVQIGSAIGENVVSSVFSRTGDVVAAADDYAADEVSFDDTTAQLTATNVQEAIEALKALIDAL